MRLLRLVFDALLCRGRVTADKLSSGGRLGVLRGFVVGGFHGKGCWVCVMRRLASRKEWVRPRPLPGTLAILLTSPVALLSCRFRLAQQKEFQRIFPHFFSSPDPCVRFDSGIFLPRLFPEGSGSRRPRVAYFRFVVRGILAASPFFFQRRYLEGFLLVRRMQPTLPRA